MNENKVMDMAKSFENIMNRSKSLNDDEFDLFLCNIELMKKNIIMNRKRYKSKIISETISFKDFFNKLL